MKKNLYLLFKKFNLLKKIFLNWLSHVNGEFAYKNYLQKYHQSHQHLHNCSYKVLSKKQFLRQRIHEKYNKITRCC